MEIGKDGVVKVTNEKGENYMLSPQYIENLRIMSAEDIKRRLLE